jgi:DNA polymerase-1
MKSFLLVDGHALIHRAYHAIPPFKTKAGFPTNAIYGFLTILNKTITDFTPEYLIVCFDTPKPTFRNKLFKDYQIKRPKAEDNLIIQVPEIKKILKSGRVLFLEKEGFEADDILGFIVHKVTNPDIKKIILTGDKDILQLVDSTTFVLTPQIGFGKSKLYDEREVENKLNVKPSQVPDYKSLAGDPSDNYIGAKGIGPKTASDLIRQFETLENLYKNIDEIKNPKTKEILKKNKDMILMAKKLALIEKNINLKFNLGDAKFSRFDEKMKKDLMRLEMRSLTTRLFDQSSNRSNNIEKSVKKEDQIELF